MVSEGEFLYQLARAESAVVPEQIVVSRITLGAAAWLSHPSPGFEPVEVDLRASSVEIAALIRKNWGVRIDDDLLQQEELAPDHVSLAVRWREIHRDLSLTDLLRNYDSEARITSIELDLQMTLARVSGVFQGQMITLPLPLLDDNYRMWEAMYSFIEFGQSAGHEQT